KWIWAQPCAAGDAESHTFTKSFTLDGPASSASLSLAADNLVSVSINSATLNATSNTGFQLDSNLRAPGFGSPQVFDHWTGGSIAGLLHSGFNTISFTVANDPGGCSSGPFCNPAGLLARLDI